jgi:glucan phosphoethanolaminetransferase (alkaline phosphatase superfamily)
MQTLGSESRRLVAALLVTLVLLIVWLMPPFSGWFNALVKLESMRIPYTAMFFAALFGVLAWLSSRISKARLLNVALAGAVIGQLLALASIFAANFWIPRGVQRNIDTIAREGFLNVLVSDFVVALILGGWVFGAVAFLALKFALPMARSRSEVAH